MNTTLLIALAVLTAGLCPAQLPYPPSVPQPTIIDTDIGYDVDDAVALGIAMRAQQLGYIKIIGVNTISGNANGGGPSLAPSLVNTLLTYGGYTQAQIPIGAQLSSTGSCGAGDNYNASTIMALGLTQSLGKTLYQSSLTNYRRLLSVAGNNSVNIVTLGPLTNIAELLASPADSISSLTGAQLWAQKVQSLVVMGGTYPAWSSDYNFYCDPTGARYVFAHNGNVPIYGIGAEIGDTIRLADSYGTSLPHTSPVAYPLALYAGGAWVFSWSGAGRAGHDPSAVFYGMIGVQAGSGGAYYSLSANGTTSVVDGNHGSWSSSTASNHYYATMARTPTAFISQLNTLIYADFLPLTRPISAHPRLVVNDTIADTWEPSKKRLTAITQRVTGGDATATAEFATLVSLVNSSPALGNGTPLTNIILARAYALVYEVYVKAGQTSNANAVASKMWSVLNMPQSLSGGNGGPVDKISQTVVTAGCSGCGGFPNTATATFASTAQITPGIGYDYITWGCGTDALNGWQHVLTASSSNFTYGTYVATGTYTDPTMYGTQYWGGSDSNGNTGAALSQLAYIWDGFHTWLVANGHDALVKDWMKVAYYANTPTRASSQWWDNVRESDYHNYSSWTIASILEAGIALYGDDPLATTMLTEGLGYFFNGQPVMPADCCTDVVEFNLKKSVDQLTDGAFNWESPAYSRNSVWNHFRAIEAYDSATNRADNLWVNQFPTAKNFGLWRIYAQRPDGYTANIGDAGNNSEFSSKDLFGFSVINDRFPDAHFVYMMNGYSTTTKPFGFMGNYWNSGGSGSDGIGEKLTFFPYVNGPGNHNLTDLPLVGAFGPDVFIRTGWGANDTYITYTRSVRGTYHRHEDAGSFTVESQGSPLILGQPYSLVEPAYTNYRRRTIGANTLTVTDPADCWKDRYFICGMYASNGNTLMMNDGGQLLSDRRLSTEFSSGLYAISRMWSGSLYTDPNWSTLYSAIMPKAPFTYAAASGYEHIKHDMTALYVNSYSGSGDNPHVKVASTNGVVREITHFQRTQGSLAPIVTFDRVNSTNAAFRKAWAIHTNGAPKVNGSTMRPGDTTTTSATSISADNGNGRVYVTPLLPTTPTVRALGGNACTPMPILGATNANPGVFHVPSHGLQVGEAVQMDTGTVRGGSIWVPDNWGLENVYGLYAVATVPDADHFSLATWDGPGSTTYSTPVNTASLPAFSTAFSGGSSDPVLPPADSGAGRTGQTYYETGAAGGNSVWQWDGSTWRNLFATFTGVGYPAGLGYTAPTIVAHTACHYAEYLDQLGPSPATNSYSSGTSYAVGDKVLVSATSYVSIQSGNVGHTPAMSPAWWVPYGAAHTWDSSVGATSYTTVPLEADWQITSSPASGATLDFFLNVVTPTTTSVGSPPTTSLISGTGLYGAQITDSGGYYVGIFGTDPDGVASLAYTSSHPGTAQHVVSGLSAGTATVRQGGNTIAIFSVDASGTVGFTETGGGAFRVEIGGSASTASSLMGGNTTLGGVAVIH